MKCISAYNIFICAIHFICKLFDFTKIAALINLYNSLQFYIRKEYLYLYIG